MAPWKILFLLACGFIAGMGHASRSQDRAAGHAEHHDVYQTWIIPGTSTSCCNEKKTAEGITVGDCYPTTAELRPSANPEIKHRVWWARLDNGRWVEVPDYRILNKEINPDPTGVSAHICANEYDAVLCFREPVGGI